VFDEVSGENAFQAAPETLYRFNDIGGQLIFRVQGARLADLIRIDIETGFAQLPAPITPRASEIENGISWPQPRRAQHFDLGPEIFLCVGKLRGYEGGQNRVRRTVCREPLCVLFLVELSRTRRIILRHTKAKIAGHAMPERCKQVLPFDQRCVGPIASGATSVPASPERARGPSEVLETL
jgi:hypothetical protein